MTLYCPNKTPEVKTGLGIMYVGMEVNIFMPNVLVIIIIIIIVVLVIMVFGYKTLNTLYTVKIFNVFLIIKEISMFFLVEVIENL